MGIEGFHHPGIALHRGQVVFIVALGGKIGAGACLAQMPQSRQAATTDQARSRPVPTSMSSAPASSSQCGNGRGAIASCVESASPSFHRCR